MHIFVNIIIISSKGKLVNHDPLNIEHFKLVSDCNFPKHNVLPGAISIFIFHYIQIADDNMIQE